MINASPKENNVDDFAITAPEGYDFSMSLIGDIRLSEKITLRANFGDKLKERGEKLNISLSKGIKHLDGELKFNLDSQTEYKDINVQVEAYGEYYISIDAGDKRRAKEYSFEIYENYASFGPKSNKIVFENLEENIKKLKANKESKKKEDNSIISIKQVGKELKKAEVTIKDISISEPVIEEINITKPIDGLPGMPEPIAEELDATKDSISDEDTEIPEENTVVDEVYGVKTPVRGIEKSLTLQETTLNIATAANSRGLVAADIVPKVAPPYIVNTQYPFEFIYGNESSTSKSNVKIGLYINETQIHTFTTTLAANTYYKLSVNFGLQNPGVHTLSMKVDEDYIPSTCSEDFLWAAKVGKAVEFNVTTSQSSPHIVGNSTPFNVSIRNIGTQYTGPLSLRVFDNNVSQGDLTLVDLQPGYTMSFTIELTIYTAGSHTIRFVLDPDRLQLPDYYAKAYTGTWKDITDIRAKSISLLGTTRPKQKETAQVRVEISNEGTLDINNSFYGTVNAQNRDTGELVELRVYRIDGIAKGTTLAATISFVGPERGRWTVRNNVNYPHQIAEDIITNNSVTVQTVFILPISNTSAYTQLAALSDMAYESYNPEYILRESGLNNWQQIENGSGSSGFKYIIMKNTLTNEYVIAFAGSADIGDYITDIVEVVMGKHDVQVPQAENVVRNFINDYPTAKFAITGHSLGGYLAAWTAAQIQDEIITTSNFTKAYTYNAPGIFPGMDIRELSPLYSETTNFIIRQDTLVGNSSFAIRHLGNEIFFESPDSGIKAHSIYQFYTHNY
jgi:hypothetical protein